MAKNKKIPKCPPLRFPEFADEWKQTTLGETCSVIGGGTPSTDVDDYWNGDIQWFTPSEIGVNKFVSRSERTITEQGMNNSGAKLLPLGTILLTTRATIGEASIATCPCTTNQGCQSLVINRRITTTEFVYQKVETLKRELFSRANGSTFKEISASEVRSIPISLPSLAEQEKIAGFLSLIDERIESCSETIKERKAQKSCLRTLILNTMIVRWIKLKQAVEQGIINLKRGEVIPKQSQSSENIYPVYSSSVQNKGLMGFHNSYMFDKELISWSIDGGGHLFYRPRHKFNVTNVCGVLETSCFDYVFLCEVLKEQHRKLLFDYQNKAHPSVIQELYQVPMLEISEQRYYGKLFRLLDERIEVEEELLEQYEKQKRYLLRQMFV